MRLRPLSLVSAACCSGVLLADLAPAVGLLLPAIAVLSVSGARWPKHSPVSLRPLARAAGAALLAAAAGQAMLTLRTAAVPGIRTSVDAVCGGVVTGFRAIGPGRAELRLRRALCRTDAGYATMGLIVYRDGADGARGAVVLFRARLRAPVGSGNPGEADRARIERRRGFGAVAHLAGDGGWRVLHPPAPVHGLVDAVRRAAAGHVARRLPDPVAGPVLLALLTGRSDAVPEETVRDFRRAGLAHVLAISGLHVGVLGGVLMLILTALLRRLPVPYAWRAAWTAALLCALLVLLVVVVGARPSVFRAAVMGGLLVVRRPLQRSGAALSDAVSVALLIQLALAPSHLFEPGFQLSHTAVYALALLRPSPVSFLSGIRASAVATAATAPIVAWHFGPVPLGGLVLNVPALPLTALAVSGGLLALLPGLDPVAASAILATRALVAVARHGAAALGGAVLLPARPEILLGLVLAGSSFLLVRSVRGRALASLLFISVTLGRPHPGTFGISFLDVGQGDAILLELPSGRHALVDTGPPNSRALVRLLTRRGIGHLSTVVITHDHADHAGGLASLSAVADIGRVVAPAPLRDRDVTVVAAGDTLDFGGGVHAWVLAPSGSGRGNASSLVLSVRFGATSFLLLGDAERPEEIQFSSVWPSLLASDVVKVGHHGSRTSSSPFLVRRVVREGTVAVVSVGRHNVYRHPDPSVVARWSRAGAAVHLTSERGALCLRSDGWRLLVTCGQESRNRATGQ